MRYLLGTDTETLTFTADGIHVTPAGLAHAVDPASSVNRSAGALAYALCGKAVIAWAEHDFDPSSEGVHDECAVRCQPRSAPKSE